GSDDRQSDRLPPRLFGGAFGEHSLDLFAETLRNGWHQKAASIPLPRTGESIGPRCHSPSPGAKRPRWELNDDGTCPHSVVLVTTALCQSSVPLRPEPAFLVRTPSSGQILKLRAMSMETTARANPGNSRSLGIGCDHRLTGFATPTTAGLCRDLPTRLLPMGVADKQPNAVFHRLD